MCAFKDNSEKVSILNCGRVPLEVSAQSKARSDIAVGAKTSAQGLKSTS